MLINVILIIILAGALGGIISILIKKFPLVSIVNVEILHREQAEKKKELLQQRFKKEIGIIQGKIKKIIDQFFSFLRKFFRKSPPQINQ